MAFLKSGNPREDKVFNEIVQQLNHEIGGTKDFKVIEVKRNVFRIQFKRLSGEKVFLPGEWTSIYAAVQHYERFENSIADAIQKIREDAVMALIFPPVVEIPSVNALNEGVLEVMDAMIEGAKLGALVPNDIEVQQLNMEIIPFPVIDDAIGVPPVYLMGNGVIEQVPQLEYVQPTIDTEQSTESSEEITSSE